MVCEWSSLKTTRTVFIGLASKPVPMVSTGLASKPAVTVFSSLASKLVAMASLGLSSKPVVGFLVEPQNQGGGGFPGLGLKTSSYGFGDLGLKITAMVSWFLGLKTKWASVCWFPHKTDGGRSVQNTRRDLVGCFVWKQVWLGFPSLA
jgi:hypothetical protein